MKRILIGLGIVIIILNIAGNTKASIIPNEAIRFRVLANSDTEYDQMVKGKVRDVLQKELYDALEESKTIEESRNIINKNMNNFKKSVKNVLTENNANYGFTIDLGKHYFPKKEYKGVTYDEGNYESLVVTLGEGKGKNWWCVLFPPLCLLEAEESDTDEVEYKFFLEEIIKKYFG